MSLDLDEDSKLAPSDVESDGDSVVCLGSEEDEEEAGAAGGFKQPDLSSVGLSQVQAPLLVKSPKASSKKLKWNRYGATLRPMVSFFPSIRLHSACFQSTVLEASISLISLVS